mmetsp:Transcript_1201/g.2897  ORF Transcript_1201/g.2897 Transcript_1201/m.2897 type:complete len:98 (+) Transcript_1201:34-327(+)
MPSYQESGGNYSDAAGPTSAQKATIVALVNGFVAETVSFLDRFVADCERRLVGVSMRMKRTESLLAILETKLRSVPGLEALDTNPRPSQQLVEDSSR